MNVRTARQRANTRQLLAYSEFSGSDQKYNLLGELLSQRNIAAFAQ